MEMTINQTRREIRAAQIDDLARLEIAKANHAAILDRHVGLVDFTAEDVDDAGVLEEKFGGTFAASHGKFLLHVAHG